MKLIKQSAIVTVILTLAVSSSVALAQYQRGDVRWSRDTSILVARIDQRASRLESSIDRVLNQSRLDNTQREENIRQVATEFRQSAADFRTRYDRRQASASDAQALLDRAARLNWIISRRQALAPVQEDWQVVRTDLDSLARVYRLTWDWEAQGGPRDDGRPGDRDGRGAAARLSGTFQLNPSQSDNARSVVERAVRSVPYSERQRVSESLLRRMDSPDRLAIERRGRMITLASSRAPQMTFEADGQEHVEQNPNNGRTSRVTASLVGDGLTIQSLGDRSSDFTVTFDPINNGRQLRVTRRLYTERLTEPIAVQSTYDQVSETARWDIYDGSTIDRSPNYPGDRDRDRNYPDRAGDQRRGVYFVPDGTSLIARLDNGLDTSRVRTGDRFSLTVVSPRQYEGARIEGTVGDVSRSGRISGRAGMNLAFDTIRLRDGRTSRFEGTIDSVRAQNGDTVRVDPEGRVADDTSQTSKTVTRSAIGTAVGAIIGAVAGGGKGAAIGAVAGAGVGAGSVYVQGRDDLQLVSGTEITIRSSAPTNRIDR